MKCKHKKAFKVSDVEDHDLDMDSSDISEVISDRKLFNKNKKVSFSNAKYVRKGVYERYLESNEWLD